MAFLVHNYPDLEEIVNACKLFGKIDINGNGKITVEDLCKGLSKLLKKNNVEEDAKKIFENLDTGGTNYLEYEVFVRAAIDKKIFLSEEALKMAFNFFDKDNKGIITFESILKIFKECVKKDKSINPEEILKKIITDIGVKNDNLNINFDVFSQLLTKILK